MRGILILFEIETKQKNQIVELHGKCEIPSNARNPTKVAVDYETSAARRLRCETLRYAGTYVSSPDTSRGSGSS
jgi:hypothetical protein